MAFNKKYHRFVALQGHCLGESSKSKSAKMCLSPMCILNVTFVLLFSFSILLTNLSFFKEVKCSNTHTLLPPFFLVHSPKLIPAFIPFLLLRPGCIANACFAFLLVPFFLFIPLVNRSPYLLGCS